MTSFTRAAVWALVIALAAVAGYLAYGFSSRARFGGDMRVVTQRADAPSPSGETENPIGDNIPALPPPSAAPARPVPQELPDFQLKDSQGELRTLAHWKDRPLVVNFWATWCEPCRREIPLLKKLRQDHSKHGIEVVGIAVDFRDAVLKYARDIGIDYPMLIGEQDGLEAIEAFGMEPVFPFTVFSDRSARIVAIKVGELHADEAELILGRVHAIDAGQLELQDAKIQIADGLRDLAVRRARETHPHDHDDPG
jgi:thiol-disulfide isomerase/thioredoxin